MKTDKKEEEKKETENQKEEENPEVKEDLNKEETIIKNELYDTLKDNIYCPLCKKLMIHPVMCMNCLNIYCNKCSDEMKEGKKK